MLYKRSSFITWVTKVYDCEVYPHPTNPRVLFIKHLNATTNMFVNSKDAIPYEEIHLHCNRLGLPEIPGEKDLIRYE